MAPAPDLFVVCRNCGSEVSGYITECPYCGTRLRKRAPKLDRPASPPSAGGRRGRGVPRLQRLRVGEIPGLAVRPLGPPRATLGLIAISAGCTAVLGAVGRFDVAVIGPLDGRWWRLLTTPFFSSNLGYAAVALLAVYLFGGGIERRHGPLVAVGLFLAAGAAGAGASVAFDQPPLALGANAAAIGLLAAWALVPLRELRRDGETDADLIGTGIYAALLLALPIVVPEASPTAGAIGLLVGLLVGLVLARRAA